MITPENLQAIEATVDFYAQQGTPDIHLSQALADTVESHPDEDRLNMLLALGMFFGPTTPLNTVMFRLEELNAQAKLEQDAENFAQQASMPLLMPRLCPTAEV